MAVKVGGGRFGRVTRLPVALMPKTDHGSALRGTIGTVGPASEHSPPRR
jgi:hypothetical protein